MHVAKINLLTKYENYGNPPESGTIEMYGRQFVQLKTRDKVPIFPDLRFRLDKLYIRNFLYNFLKVSLDFNRHKYDDFKQLDCPQRYKHAV